MKRALALILVLSLIATTLARSDVVDVNRSNFDKVVLKSKVPVFLEFFAPWCGHCKSLAPVYEKLATLLKDIVVVAKVDATVEDSLTREYQVKGFPTLKLFLPGVTTPSDYQFSRTVEEMSSFITNSFINHVKSVSGDPAEMWNSYPTEVPRVILFSSKPTPTVMFKSLALRFKDSAVFYQISSEQEEIGKLYNIEASPTLFFQAGKNETPIKHSDALSPAAIINFLSSHISKAEAQNAKSQKSSKATSLPLEWVSSTLDQVFTNESTKIALILLQDSPTSEIAKVLSSYFKGLKIFSFFILDASETERIQKMFNLDPNVPTNPGFIIYNSRRNRYVASPTYNQTTILNMVDRVLSGDIKWTLLK